MLKRHKKYTCLLMAVLISACGNVQKDKTEPHLNHSKVVQEIQLMFDQYHNAIYNEGLTGEFAYLDSTDAFFWVPPGYRSALSYDSVRAILIQNDKSLARMELNWDTLQILPLKPDIATYTGIVNCTTTDTSGVVSNVQVIESGTLIKRADGWRLLNGQSAVLPAESN